MSHPEPPFASASLYVGDLHPDVNETMLFDIFNDIGPVVSIRVCRESSSRKSLGYAYVNYQCVSDAERALDTLNYTPIKSTPCRIMWSHRDPSLRRSGNGNIFVKNLDKVIDNKALYDTFSLFGNILSCKVATDENGLSKGYGFVHYESEDSARHAIDKVNNMQIESKTVYVGLFKKRSERRSEAGEIFTNVYVKNFPNAWTEETLKSIFGKYGEITSVALCHDRANRPFAFINFAEPAAAKTCVESLHGKKTTSSGIVEENDHKKTDVEEPKQEIDTTKEKVEDKNMNQEEQVVTESKNYKTLDENVKENDLKQVDNLVEDKQLQDIPSELESGLYVQRAMSKAERKSHLKQASSPMGSKQKQSPVNLFIKNLEPTVTDDLLLEAFSKFGTVLSAKVMRDELENSKGFGFVTFAFANEATSAVTAMHLNMFHGKPLYVGLAEKRDHRSARLQQRFRASNNAMRFAAYTIPSAQPTVAPMMMNHGNSLTPQLVPFHQNAPNASIYYGSGNISNLQHPIPVHTNVRSPIPQMPYVGGHLPVSGSTAVWPQREALGASQSFANTTSIPTSNYPTYPLAQGVATNVGNNVGLHPNFTFTPQARNRQGFATTHAEPSTVTSQSQVQHLTTGLPQSDVNLVPSKATALSAQMLATAHPQIQKKLLGEKLFPLIHKRQPDLAGKITGMMLEMDNVELLSLLDSDSRLDAKVNEALGVLRRHQQGLTTTQTTSACQASTLSTTKPGTLLSGPSVINTTEIPNA
ncbi:uncharacterized protein LOC128883119 [Hylaeus volcanicus]|uniref:uncharacterized protein LOC128883119 n=1 Tax=Hylaeus volcanicus TaxID=313075 RepID=UPI0023B7824E|nr:uncharacterized protein LOC128883119 [Hylaeus volcanicus]